MRKKSFTVLCILLILFTTYAYSALSTQLSIVTDANLKAIADIRFSNIFINNGQGDTGTILYQPEYGIDSLNTGFNLPTSSSTITYTATVANNGDFDYIIYDSSITSSNNPGISYTTSYVEDEEVKTDLSKHVIHSHETFSFNITFTGAAGNSYINTGFVFKKVYSPKPTRIIGDIPMANPLKDAEKTDE